MPGSRASLLGALGAALLVLAGAWPEPLTPTAQAREPEAREAQRGAQRRARRRRRGRRRRGLTPAYRRMRARWHRRPSRAQQRAWEALDPPPMVLRPVGQSESYALVPSGPDGGFGPLQRAMARRAFTHRDGGSHDVHPRLLELVYRAVRRFDAPWVTVVSGYRPTRRTSRHNQGRAVDMVLPGVSDRRLARFLRDQGFVGVGIYPVSGFVHLDVREQSFFWTDGSGPGARSRVRPMLRSETFRADRRARDRGEESVPDLVFQDEEGPVPDEGAVPLVGVDGGVE